MTNVLLFLPEIALLLTSLLLFFCPVSNISYQTSRALAFVGAAVAFVASIYTMPLSGDPFTPGYYHVDFFSQFIKVGLSGALLAAVVLSREPVTIRRSVWTESLLFMVLSTCGMLLLASATELLTLFVAMELAAFPLYVLAALHRNQHRGSEGAVKYMLQGIAASAITAFGMSFIYGTTHTTLLGPILANGNEFFRNGLFVVGMLFAMGGFLFKLASFPFHFWAPDTYQTTPHEVTSFLATASKIGAAAVLCRFAAATLPIGKIVPPAETFRMLLQLSAIVGMTIGNLAALVQRDLKRLLGYSAVAHAGYMLVGLQAGTQLGLASVLFYVIGYAAISWLCFLVIAEIGRHDDSVTVAGLSGLHQRSPILALALMVGIFGLTGLPPTVGFIGKWFLFSAAMEQKQIALVLLAAINSVVALYYYMKIIKAAYYDPPITDAPLAPLPGGTFLAAIVVMLLVVWMGTAPGPIWSAVELAARALQPVAMAR